MDISEIVDFKFINRFTYRVIDGGQLDYNPFLIPLVGDIVTLHGNNYRVTERQFKFPLVPGERLTIYLKVEMHVR